eukprot:NODE_904_length_3225_cov_0.289827.p2 type:complete len:317 gc:universal NODE_904_length_3225_cov_0.289827:3084-2134(-)
MKHASSTSLLLSSVLLTFLSVFSNWRLDVFHYLLAQLLLGSLFYRRDVLKGKESPKAIKDESESSHEMVSTFISRIESDEWKLILDSDWIRVFKHNSINMCFKTVANLNCDYIQLFDIVANPKERLNWDTTCEVSCIKKVISKNERITYLKTLPMFPVSSRDMILHSRLERVDDNRLINVTKSVSEEEALEIQDISSGTIRMHAGLAGVMVIKGSSTDCQIIQVADGNPGGWVPQSAIDTVIKIKVPESLKKLEAYCKKTKIKTHSDVVDNFVAVEAEDGVVLRKKYEGFNFWKVGTYLGILSSSTLLYFALKRRQ